MCIEMYWFLVVLDAIWSHFEVLAQQFGIILVIIGCKGALRGPKGTAAHWSKRPIWICIDFWRIWSALLLPCWGHFLIFCVMRAIRKYVWIAGAILDDFWLEYLMNTDVPIVQKHSKNCDFHQLSVLLVFCDFHGFRHLLGAYFGHFWESWGSIFKICWCIGVPWKLNRNLEVNYRGEKDMHLSRRPPYVDEGR